MKYIQNWQKVLTHSYISIFSHPYLVTFVFLLQIGLISAFAFFHFPITNNMQTVLYAASQNVQEIVEASTNDPTFIVEYANKTLLSIILNDNTLQGYAFDFAKLVLLLATATYLVYTLFQSATARIIGRMVWRKQPYTILAFIRINLIWFGFYLIGRFFILVADIIFTINKDTPAGLALAYPILHIIMFYFIFISYAQLQDGKAWQAVKASVKLGITQIKYYGLNYIPFALYLFPTTKSAIDAVFILIEEIPFIGIAIPILILFFFYLFFIANVFSIRQLINEKKFA
ncbi:MAG TPA: hypothetical protein VK158_06105 [Acidobacteriota bacterium]|nr:hypothetical protein [Acidobacteriota bacterium]